TAIRLAMSGLKVLIVEQKRFPREKLCGEFISPECLPIFDELGIKDEILSGTGTPIQRTVFYAATGRSVSIASKWFASGSAAMGLSRAAMDAALLLRARSVGVTVLEETTAVGLVTENKRVIGLALRSPDEKCDVLSHLTIDATGRSRVLARQIEKARHVARPRGKFVAFKAHLSGAEISPESCEIYAYKGGYGGCIGVEGGLHNLCFIVSTTAAKEHNSNAGDLVRNIVMKNRRASQSLKKFSVNGNWLAVPIEQYGRFDLAPTHGLLSVGDAAAFMDPFTGSGILIALQNSAVVTTSILDYFQAAPGARTFELLGSDYRARYAKIFGKRLRMASLLRRAAFLPGLAELIVQGLALNESITRYIARATRSADPTSE
ncbi:MAG: NAD(P)/FAD-dependent oxidoreductase, partial [Pyrinomonadaceae bacterium]